MSVSFVTGATGQIGLPLVRTLVGRGHVVRALVRDEARASAVREAGAELVVGTLEDAAALESGIRGATHVWHLAGGIRGAGKVDADQLNHIGTHALCEVARRHRSTLESLVYASSCSVYGDRSGLWVAEDYAPAPHTRYGESKVAAEAVLLRAAREEKLPVKIARIAAVYGPGLRFMQAEQMKAGRAWLPGEGRNHVPIVHVDDCVSALLVVAERAETGGIVHVSSRSTPTLKEFYAEVHKHAGGTPLRFWSTWIPSAIQFAAARRNEALQARMGRRPRFTPDNLRLMTASVRLKLDRLEKEFGFTWAHPDFREGLAASFGASSGA